MGSPENCHEARRRNYTVDGQTTSRELARVNIALNEAKIGKDSKLLTLTLGDEGAGIVRGGRYTLNEERQVQSATHYGSAVILWWTL
ncbi:hypothetical protein RRG08_048093 [Elysia crispata]|uniref:Uncharacterized protein n=1 Tax=Elysia crispata TaxID=231223 RepID=A0AAE1E9M2_9GAST|nr:hypothetical protein RRG08_048093 [Elysia crispata]